MPTETTARADQQSDAPDEGDYQVFCEALSASARGRAFLAEYTRRNRNADTEQLLAAIERLQLLVTSNATPHNRRQSNRNCVRYSTRSTRHSVSLRPVCWRLKRGNLRN